jgi:hypothetical protein
MNSTQPDRLKKAAIIIAKLVASKIFIDLEAYHKDWIISMIDKYNNELNLELKNTINVFNDMVNERIIVNMNETWPQCDPNYYSTKPQANKSEATNQRTAGRRDAAATPQTLQW